ncbi:MAG: aminodeoxychorismate/anthranilate synthase component II [Planctomycetota bacterium]|nr:MAG: aminodeoxychorismate/anthranilate synthase component II [Planctomycetota bacterium]
MLLLLDNYDSFVHNLARHFRRLGQETIVMRNDAVDVAAVRAMRPGAIVISPGPCTPREAGCSVDIVRELGGDVPILGVCLGHQAIAAAFGARIVRAAEPVHGRTSEIRHAGTGLFEQVPSPLAVCRYHSLVVDERTLPGELEVTARTGDGAIMAIAHRTLPVVGVQFHPEAALTEHGYRMLANFLRIAGMEVREPLPEGEVVALSGEIEAVDWPLPGAGAGMVNSKL